ncbi:hypothetical protein [Streptomyces sp. A1499]|uniref:hypothetical protein n=1 Tax=Streptomyces sp. A1499 TaxID=2563104 RepID=UPI00144A8AFD|nr:hypothetical protein [Streptomyces sp. A1499]
MNDVGPAAASLASVDEMAYDLVVDVRKKAPPPPGEGDTYRVEVQLLRGPAGRHRARMQHDQIGGVGIPGPDQRLCAHRSGFVVKDGDQSVRQMPQCLLRDGRRRLKVNRRIDDDLVVRAGIGEGVVIYGEPTREVDDARGLAPGEGRQEGVDPLQF